jgi:ubiquinone biosynthesis monooxygenase Coq6
MQVWDGISGSRISFDWTSETPSQKTAQETTIAYMTENPNLTSALLGRLKDLGGISIFDKTRVQDITLGAETDILNLSSWPIIHLDNGHSMAARLLVGADGGNSPVRTFAGIGSKGWDYDRHGVVATVKLENAWKSRVTRTAYQRFLPTGPVALLPVRRSLASQAHH